MTAVHHLDDATLMRFASGDLDEAFSVVVAAHIASCKTCRNGLRKAETCGGHLLTASDESRLDDNALSRLRDRIRDSEISVATSQSSSQTPVQISSSELAVPGPLRRYIGSSFDCIEWTSVAPGIKKYDIQLASETNHKLYMLHIAAGKEVPEHGHGGAEMTAVLSGAYHDSHGRFGPGDVADLDEHDEHQPKVEGSEPCICLIAAEGFTKPKNFLARWLQPFVRI